ncbi:hypothetical protein ACFLTD_03800 [Elusimicrobiota bacterium]
MKSRIPALHLWVFSAYLIFAFTWIFEELVTVRILQKNNWINLIYFYTVVVIFTGIIIPLFIITMKKLRFKSTSTADYYTGGIISFIIALVIGVFLSDAGIMLIKSPPSAVSVIKHLLVYIPVSFAVTLHCMFLIPMVIVKYVDNIPHNIFKGTAVSAIAAGFIFFAHSGFDQVNYAVAFSFLCIFIALGAIFTRSFYVTVPVVISIFTVNGIARGLYYQADWSVLIAGFTASICSFLYFVYFKDS